MACQMRVGNRRSTLLKNAKGWSLSLVLMLLIAKSVVSEAVHLSLVGEIFVRKLSSVF